MSKGTRLLFVVNEAEFFLSHRLPLALAARAQGYSVHVATPYSDGVDRIRAAGLEHHEILLSRRGMHPLGEWRVFWRLLQLYRRLQPEIVHHVTIKPVIYGGLAARLARVPAVVSAVSGLGYVFISQGMRASVLRAAVRRAYRLALAHPNSKVILQNPDDVALFVRHRLVRSEQVVMIKGSGVDLHAFVPAPEPTGRPLVLFASRMLRDKGICEFIAAAKALKKAGVAARFVLVGDIDPGNPASVTEATIKGWCAEGSTEWWGRRNDMQDVIAQAHVVCLPSYREGLPKVLIEAAACGKAIVATDVPGCREVVRADENGLLVAAGDVPALTMALKELIEDRERRGRMGARGREIAEKEFDVEQVVARTLAIYEELSATARGQRELGAEVAR